MEFGKVEPELIDTINFSLPKDTEITETVLAEAKNDTSKPQIFIGCAKWGRKEWVGSIYPKGTKDAQFLDHYVKHFNSIELNATHYKMPDITQIAKWAEKADGVDFKFCPKVPQVISHFSNLRNAESLTNTFLEGISAFKEKLGPVFLQVSDKFTTKRFDELEFYLSSLPKDMSFFLEVRHPDWFGKPEISSKLFNTLRNLNIGAVITDASGRRDCVHMNITTPKAFIRYVGNSLHPTDYKRIDEWVERVKKWFDSGLQELYFFMHQHDEKDSPELCDYVIEKMNTRLGTDVKRPKFIESTGKLF